MSMSKKDFIALADDIRMEHKHGNWQFTDYQLEFLANFCKSQNPQFRRERWLGYIRGENGQNGGKVKRERL